VCVCLRTCVVAGGAGYLHRGTVLEDRVCACVCVCCVCIQKTRTSPPALHTHPLYYHITLSQPTQSAPDQPKRPDLGPPRPTRTKTPVAPHHQEPRQEPSPTGTGATGVGRHRLGPDTAGPRAGAGLEATAGPGRTAASDNLGGYGSCGSASGSSSRGSRHVRAAWSPSLPHPLPSGTPGGLRQQCRPTRVPSSSTPSTPTLSRSRRPQSRSPSNTLQATPPDTPASARGQPATPARASPARTEAGNAPARSPARPAASNPPSKATRRVRDQGPNPPTSNKDQPQRKAASFLR